MLVIDMARNHGLICWVERIEQKSDPPRDSAGGFLVELETTDTSIQVIRLRMARRDG